MTSTQRLTPVALALCAALSSAQQFQDQTATRLPVQAVWSEEVDAADLDGDGDLDLVYAKGDGFASAGAPRQNTILINDGTGVFADQTATRLPALTGNAKDVDLVDVDGDGDFDLVVANGFGQQPRLFLNDGTGTFTNVTATHFPVLTLNSFSSAAADVDADGDLDLFFSDSGASTFGGTGGQTRLFINDGTGHFANETATRMPAVNIVAAVDLNVADVDGDFDIDVMVVSRDGSPSKMFKNDGRGFFVEAPLPSDGSGTYEYEIGDVDGDSDADVFVIGVSGLTEGTFVNDGTGTFTLGAGTVVGNASSDDNDAALGDVDSDGDWDCAVAALTTAERFFLNNGAGVFTFQAGFVTAFVDSSMDGEFADVDDDGDLDYLSAVGESGAFQNRIYINTSATAADNDAPTFRLPAYGPQTPFGPLMVRVGVRDVMATDGDPEYQSVTLHWTVGGVPGSAPMTWAGADLFQALMPGGAQGVPITLYAECTDRAGNLGTSATAAFSPLAFPPVVLSVTTTGVGDVTITLDAPMQAFAEEYVLVSAATNLPLGAGPFLGLGADALLWFNLPFGVAPFHYFLDANGHLATSFPAGTLPLGLTLDARAVTFPLGPPQLSNLVRRAF